MPDMTKKELQDKVMELAEALAEQKATSEKLAEQLDASEADRKQLAERLDAAELERLAMAERMDKAEEAAGLPVDDKGPRDVYRVVALTDRGFCRIGRRFTTDPTFFELDELSPGDIEAIEKVPTFLRIDKVRAGE